MIFHNDLPVPTGISAHASIQRPSQICGFFILDLFLTMPKYYLLWVILHDLVQKLFPGHHLAAVVLLFWFDTLEPKQAGRVQQAWQLQVNIFVKGLAEFIGLRIIRSVFIFDGEFRKIICPVLIKLKGRKIMHSFSPIPVLLVPRSELMIARFFVLANGFESGDTWQLLRARWTSPCKFVALEGICLGWLEISGLV